MRLRPYRHSLLGLLVSLLIVLLLGLYGTAEFMLRTAICPEPSPYRREATARDTMIHYVPALRPWLDSLDRAQALHDTTIIAPDGTPLHARYVRSARPTQRVALLVHGYGDAAGRMYHLGRMYARSMNAHLLLPDLRYHGRTPGTHIGMGWNDRLDVLRWAKLAPRLFRLSPDSLRLVVHGISMGAATTMMLSGTDGQPYYLRAFVEDCGYTSVRDIFTNELRVRYGLPAFPIIPATSALCKWRYGWSFNEASALEAVRRCRKPMFFIHGGNDHFVPTAMVHPLYAAKPGIKALWIAPHSAHAMSYIDHPEEYERRVHQFLDRHAW